METRRQLSDALRVLKESIFDELRVAIPAEVESYTPSLASADVIPSIKRFYRDGTEQDMPKIASVPVVWPRTSTALFALPLKRGDRGLLIFSDRSLDRWSTTGQNSAPEDRRKHALSDAMFVPGLYPFSTPNTLQDNADDVILKYNLSEVRIKPNGKFVFENAQVSLKDVIEEIIDETTQIAQTLLTETVIIPGGSSAGTYPLVNAATYGSIAGRLEDIADKLYLLLEGT